MSDTLINIGIAALLVGVLGCISFAIWGLWWIFTTIGWAKTSALLAIGGFSVFITAYVVDVRILD